MRLLCETLLALGVFFGSLAVPLTLDGYLSSSIWAFEGAGMVWVGLRWQRVLVRHCGLLLQLAAAFIFIDSVWYPLNALPFVNRYFLGCLLMAVAAFFSSYHIDTSQVELKKWERFFPLPLLIWGFVWWYIGGLREVDRQIPLREAISGLLLFCSASSIIMGLTIKKLYWPRFKLSLLIQLPAMVVLVFMSLVHSHSSFYLLRGWGAVAWTVAFAVQYRILYSYANTWPKRYREHWHSGSMWLLLYVVCHETAWWIGGLDGIAPVWSVISWALIPCALLVVVIQMSKGLTWPVGKYSSVYLGLGSVAVLLAVFCWIVASFTLAGDPAPLWYVPFINPLEIAEVIVILCLTLWVQTCQTDGLLLKYIPVKGAVWTLGVLVFCWLNSVVARSVHFFAGVPYNLKAFCNSVIFQASITALWGVGALTITVWAARKGSRSLWSVGAVLLAMVVVKLLVVDLSGTGTITCIVAFLVVGILMFLIGYFSPLPPPSDKKEGR